MRFIRNIILFQAQTSLDRRSITAVRVNLYESKGNTYFSICIARFIAFCTKMDLRRFYYYCRERKSNSEREREKESMESSERKYDRIHQHTNGVFNGLVMMMMMMMVRVSSVHYYFRQPPPPLPQLLLRIYFCTWTLGKKILGRNFPYTLSLVNWPPPTPRIDWEMYFPTSNSFAMQHHHLFFWFEWPHTHMRPNYPTTWACVVIERCAYEDDFLSGQVHPGYI